MSTAPRREVRIPSRRVKSQENLSSSLTSDRDLLPLSSSKDTLLSERKGSLSWDTDSCTHCSLVWQRSFAYPVIGMNRLDIMDDGMEDLIVVTLKGIHILQPDMNEVASVCLERLRMLADNSPNLQSQQDQSHPSFSLGQQDTDSVSPSMNG